MCRNPTLLCTLAGKITKKSIATPTAEKDNNEEKMDKPQATSKKEQVGRISMFTVPMKITPTKPASKVAPKRITLTPVPVKPSVVSPTVAESTGQATPCPVQNVQPATSTAGLQPSPAGPKQMTIMSVQGQLNTGNASAANTASQITPRRVSLMPAVSSQANKSSDENKPTAQVPPRRIALMPVDSTSTNNTATTEQEPNLVPGQVQTPNITNCKVSSNGDGSSLFTTSSGDAGTRGTSLAQTSTLPQTTPSVAPRRVALTTLTADVCKGYTNQTAQPSQPPGTCSKSDFKASETSIDQGVSQQKIAKENVVSSCTNTEPTPVVKPDTTVNSCQPRRMALTPVPMETQSPSITSLVDKENNKVDQPPITNDQPQPRRVTLTTLTPHGSENTPVEQQQNSSKKCQAPRRPIPLEPTVIVLED